MLVLEPTRRYTTEQVLNHRWTKSDGPDPTFDKMFAEHNMETNRDDGVNETVLQHMVSTGLHREKILEVFNLNFVQCSVSVLLYSKLLKKKVWKFKFDWSYLSYYHIFFIIIGIIKKLV